MSRSHHICAASHIGCDTMLRTIHLHGALGDEFGGPYIADVSNPRETCSALIHQLPGIEDRIRTMSLSVVGSRDDEPAGISYAEDQVTLGFPASVANVHLVPIVAGAKRGGALKVVLGIALIGVALVAAPAAGAGFAGAGALGGEGASGAILAGSTGILGGLGATAFAGISFGQIALFGASLALSGISQLIAPTPGNLGGEIGAERPAQRPSFFFNGPLNVTEEGHPIPLVYGRMIVGSVVVSGGIEAERI